MESSSRARLQEHGLRITAPRVALLEAVSELGGHPDAAAIAVAVRERIGSVSVQAVYDILHAFTEAGLLRRIQPPGSPARYETRVADNHHHLICRTCGATVDVDCAVGEAPCLRAGEAHGFVVDEAEIVFWGTCPACNAA